MSGTVISVENLSKQYRLGQIGGRTLTEDLNRWWARARCKPNPYLKIGQEDASDRDGEYIWALRDVNFTIEQGEVLGIPSLRSHCPGVLPGGQALGAKARPRALASYDKKM